MKRKVFALANVLVLLLIAGMLAVLALPKAAEAHQLTTIEWIRIYKLGDSITRSEVTQAQLPLNFNAPGPNGPSGYNGENSNLAGYFEIDDTTGEPRTGIRVTSSETVLGAGDIVGIAIRFTNISDLRGSTRISLADWQRGGPGEANRSGESIPHGKLAVNHFFGNNDWEISGQQNLANFTALFSYQIRPGDFDDDGEWFGRNTSNRVTPFVGNENHIWHRSPNIHYSGLAEVRDNITYDDNVTSIVYPKIDGGIRLYPTVKSLSINAPPAGQSGPSRYHMVRQGCLEDHRKYGDIYTAACELVHAHGWALPTGANAVTLANSPEAAYYRAGDPFEVTVKFSKAVKVNTNNPPSFYAKLDAALTEFIYVSGTGTDELTFRLEGGVKTFRWFYDENGKLKTEGHRAFGAIELDPEAFWPNTHTGWRRRTALPRNEQRIITDLFDREFDTGANLERQLWAFFTRYGDDYAFGIIKYLVDTIPATVWIPGVIKNGVTHREDRRIAAVNLDASYTAIPAMTADDLREAVTESDVQTGAFDVEFRFFNHHRPDGAIADEVGISFTGDDVEITGADVERDEWDVEIAYIGLDNRATNQWPPSDRPGQPAGSAHKPGHAKNSASFLVYKATIRPVLGFQGDVAIRLPAGATQDIARNDSLASNTLTVPVNIPFQVVEKPKIVEPAAGVYTAGEQIAVEVTYNREGLRYEGEAPPYLTLYLGEKVPANARHATWESAEDANSTKVTFAYTVAANDFADSVSVAPVGLTVPAGTRLVDAGGSQLLGTSQAEVKGSGEAPARVPPQGQLPFGRDVSPVVSDTPVVAVIYFPPDASDPKSPASSVPREPIVFNELGNGSGDTNDWLELRNVEGSDKSLNGYELSVVADGKKEDKSLIVFGDVSVPANGLLLITNSDPTDEGNVLAGGDDAATAAVETKGSPHLYLVNAGLSLPDDGKFLLILRNAKEKLGLNEAFVDVAGGGGSDTDAFIREQTGDYDTHVWPLQVREAPGGDTEDALSSGKVWQRAKADIVGYHKDAWAESAFTGIGYDRKVSESAAAAGTPGYPNGAVKTEATTPKGSVTLSEIMFDSGGGTLPQWIELYNNSKTDAINLNRWKLEIQNVDSEDLDGRPIVTLTLQEKVIQPNQTLLIVAGPARASSDSYLPADRVYDLLALHEKNLRIKSARETFLSAEGFYLKLTDRNDNVVDEVGNTDGNRRTKAAPAWTLPLSGEAGVRSSLIRRYTDGTSVAKDGTERGNWVLAANVKKVVAGGLHWGDADDIGTPGYRKGGALPVELSSFSLTRTEAGAVVLIWTTESEVDNAGFNLRRSEQRASGFTLLNPALIAGAGTTGERQTYAFTDTSAKHGVEYYYQIEEVAFNGKPETLVTRLLPGPVSAANRMLTSFGAMKKAK